MAYASIYLITQALTLLGIVELCVAMFGECTLLESSGMMKGEGTWLIHLNSMKSIRFATSCLQCWFPTFRQLWKAEAEERLWSRRSWRILLLYLCWSTGRKQRSEIICGDVLTDIECEIVALPGVVGKSFLRLGQWSNLPERLADELWEWFGLAYNRWTIFLFIYIYIYILKLLF